MPLELLAIVCTLAGLVIGAALARRYLVRRLPVFPAGSLAAQLVKERHPH